MKKRSRLDYTYSVGRVRALERNLISSSVFRESLDEKDLSGTIKVLFDSGSFSKDWSDIEDAVQLDEILEHEEDLLNKTVDELLQDEDLYRILEMIGQPRDALVWADKFGNPFVTDYIKHSIDLGNLKTFLRYKYIGLPLSEFRVLISEGGFVEKKTYLDHFSLSYSEFGEKLHVSPYKHLWEKVTDVLSSKNTFLAMEKGFEDFLMDYLRRARFVVFGPEPVFAYALARKKELMLTRLVVTGKMNQIPSGMIKQRISETYV
jgi:V/A-type H+-transporting ATPase subunit C